MLGPVLGGTAVGKGDRALEAAHATEPLRRQPDLGGESIDQVTRADACCGDSVSHCRHSRAARERVERAGHRGMQRVAAPLRDQRRFERIKAGVWRAGIEESAAQPIHRARTPQGVERHVGLGKLRGRRCQQRRHATRREAGADHVVLFVGVDDLIARPRSDDQ